MFTSRLSVFSLLATCISLASLTSASPTPNAHPDSLYRRDELPRSHPASLYRRDDLPPGLPVACYCNYTGCQYGPISDPVDVTIAQLTAANGTQLDHSAQPGDEVTFAWNSLECFPNSTFAIVILNGSTMSNVYGEDPGLVGSKLIGLGGHNGSANGTLVFDGNDLEYGGNYQATLVIYNTTTGVIGGVPSGIDFTWESPYPGS